MKLNLDQLKSSLQDKLAPIYLLSGDEELLKDEAIESISKAAAQKDFSAFEKFDDSSTNFLENFTLQAKSYSLFAEKTVLKVFLNKKPDKKTKTALQSYAEKPSKDKLLILITPKLDASTLKTKWIKAIEKAGVLIRIWPPDARNLPSWTLNRLRQHGLNANLEIATLIANKNANNLLAIKQEIEKLSLIFTEENKTLTFEETATILSNNSKFTTFDLADYALAGNRNQIATLLQNLKDEGVEPILLLWTLVRDIQTLIKLNEKKKTNPNIQALLEQERVFYKRKQIMGQALRRLNLAKLTTLVKKAAKIDRVIKGAESGNVWLELLSLSLKLAS